MISLASPREETERQIKRGIERREESPPFLLGTDDDDEDDDD